MNLKRLTVLLAIGIIVSLSFLGVAHAKVERVLQQNMRGSDVAEVQKTLNSLGYSVKVDGIFGPDTEEAVRSFQQDNGLLADGIIGSETIEAMEATTQNQIHKVIPGDSLSTLAVKYNSTVADIMAANDLTDDIIYIGQRLVIPKTKYGQGTGNDHATQPAVASQGSPVMLTYQVQRGESTYVIAKRFNSSVAAIAEANGLTDPSRLKVGQKLLVPTNSGGTTEDFIWPALGPISSDYGWRTHPIYKNRQFHGGIDIAVPTGTEVRAAAAGTVIRAGDMDGFGLGIVIDHGNGVTTWYGHNSLLRVKAGETVVRGQVIAESGNTGVSTGPHVDFRIKINGSTVNPETWLPKL